MSNTSMQAAKPQKTPSQATNSSPTISLRGSIKQQWQVLKHDSWLLSCLTWIPLLLACLLSYIFSAGLARDLPVGVVDLANDRASRSLIRHIDATAALAVSSQYLSAEEAMQAMIKGDIYGYLVIPAHFEKDIYSWRTPQASLFYNSQFLLIAKTVSSAVTQAQRTFAAKISTSSSLLKGNTTLMRAMAQSVTIRTQITPLFNRSSNYHHFLLPAIIPTLWQLFVVITAIMVFAANHRLNGQQWTKARPLQSILFTMLPYLVIYMLYELCFLLYCLQSYPAATLDQLAVLMLAAFSTTLACIVMGTFFYFLTLDPARAMSYAGVMTAPSFAFLGASFPDSEMPYLAQAWRSMLPVSHYFEVQVQVLNYQIEPFRCLEPLLPHLGYLPLCLLSCLLFNKQAKRQRVANA